MAASNPDLTWSKSADACPSPHFGGEPHFGRHEGVLIPCRIELGLCSVSLSRSEHWPDTS